MKLVILAALVALAASLPTNFDSRTQWPECGFFILNQEQCGSCWDFCSMESFADRLCINGEAASGTIISPEPILECSSQGCDGGWPSTAWGWVIDNGGDTTCTGQCFGGCAPYDSGKGTSPSCHSGTCDDKSNWPVEYQAGSFQSLSGLFNHDLNLYQTELYDNGPLQACFTVYNNFYTFFSRNPTGIYTSSSGANVGGHCVKMVGWGTESGQDYWLFANSWDTTWGDGGYFKMARGNNLCGIEGQVSEGFTKSQAIKKGITKFGIAENVTNDFLVGGWTKQTNLDDEMIVEAAEKALALLSVEMHREFSLESIVHAQTQVVAGANFKLEVRTVDGPTVRMRVYRDLKFNFNLINHELVF